MKKELTLKHGVILATAVLLIAGIAFAGAAAADPVKVDWSETLINSTGGDFIINDLHGSISGLYQNETNPLVLTKDLTLDFGYQTVRLVDAGDYTSESGVLGMVGFASSGVKLTIKNLIIDGGELEVHEKPTGQRWNRSLGAIISTFPGTQSGMGSGGIVKIENVTVENVKLYTTDSVYGLGGMIGTTYAPKIDFYNCSVIGSTINGNTANGAGGLLGVEASGNAVTYRLASVKNCYIYSNSYTGGISGLRFAQSNIYDSVVENCVVVSKYSRSGGIFAGNWKSSGTVISSNVSVNNSVITGNIVGGYYGGFQGLSSGSTLDCGFNVTSTSIDYCTIVGKSLAAGFISDIPSSIKPGMDVNISSNTVSNTCVVATNSDGVAAGFIAKDNSA